MHKLSANIPQIYYDGNNNHAIHKNWEKSNLYQLHNNIIYE